MSKYCNTQAQNSGELRARKTHEEYIVESEARTISSDPKSFAETGLPILVKSISGIVIDREQSAADMDEKGRQRTY